MERMTETPIDSPNLEQTVNTTNATPQKSSNSVLWSIIVVILLLVVGAGAYYAGMQQGQNTAQREMPSQPTPDSDQIICTLEAKICPDGSSVGRSGPNCEFEECPVSEVSQGTAFSLITSQANMKDPSTFEKIKNDNVDIVVTLPKGSKVDKNQVTINGVRYTVDVNVFASPCGMQITETDCGFDEEVAQDAEVLKVWRNNQGVFALNYISVKLNDYSLPSIFITKLAPDTYISFTEQEVATWKQIYSTIHIVNKN